MGGPGWQGSLDSICLWLGWLAGGGITWCWGQWRKDHGRGRRGTPISRRLLHIRLLIDRSRWTRARRVDGLWLAVHRTRDGTVRVL
ncbi:hypothetical protein QBC39DRAFT_347456, partial [Podospora conica]